VVTSSQRPDAPRQVRGASSWARRVNEGTVEWLAAIARITATVGALGIFAVLVAATWVHTASSAERFGVTMGLLVLLTAGSGWLGFVVLANPEWRDDDDGSQ
jgi:hypothetical protein